MALAGDAAPGAGRAFGRKAFRPSECWSLLQRTQRQHDRRWRPTKFPALFGRNQHVHVSLRQARRRRRSSSLDRRAAGACGSAGPSLPLVCLPPAHGPVNMLFQCCSHPHWPTPRRWHGPSLKSSSGPCARCKALCRFCMSRLTLKAGSNVKRTANL
jgi:hypothetical protein